MENNFCFKSFILLGVHPQLSACKWRVTLNNFLTACVIVLAFLKCYLDRDLQIVETISALIVIMVKYVALALGRKKIKQILEANELFWKVNVADDQITYLLQHFNGVQKIYKNILILAILIYVIGPFVSNASSIFNCYIPPFIPFPLFYTVEFYVIINAAFAFVSFDIFICSLIVVVAVQFRLVNLRIVDVNTMEIENDHDVEIYIRKLKSIIKYQQFLMRFVDYLNELLSVPIALLMVTSVALKCISMYNMTINQGSISDKGRTIVTILSVIAEFFLAYGLPAQILMDESTATADTIYSECKWYLPKLRCLRCHFLIMMTRNQRGVCIRAGNYHVINNGTVLLMVKTAYSFYAFLQNVT